MNILYLAHRIPYPPNKGDKLRAFRQIEHLSRRHRVTCACFVDAPTDMRYVDDLRRSCEGVVAIPISRKAATVRGLVGLATGGTVTEHFYRSEPMRLALRDLNRQQRFDAVVAFSSCMAPYALTVPADRRVLDLCDLDSAKWAEYAAYSNVPKRWLYRLEGKRLAAQERAWINAFDASILISNAEAKALAGGVDERRLHFVTNGVDLPHVNHRGVSAKASDTTAPSTVGFVGVMDYFPNVDAVCWFTETCWEAIRRAVPRATFRIVGRSPVPRVQRLSRISGVVVTGEVANVQDELDRFDVSVAPLRIARGLQNKVLESMAAGVPVVLTAKAAEGIAARPDHDFVVVDDAAAMIRATIELCCDDARRNHIARDGRRFVAAHHNWEHALEQFELIVTGATAPKTSAVEPLPRRAPVVDHAAIT